MLAHSQGSVLNAAQLARSLAVDGKTIARCLDLMVDLLLVRRLQPFHANVKKRLVGNSSSYRQSINPQQRGCLHKLLSVTVPFNGLSP